MWISYLSRYLWCVTIPPPVCLPKWIQQTIPSAENDSQARGHASPIVRTYIENKEEINYKFSPEEWVRMMKLYYNYDEKRLTLDEWHKSIFFQVPEVKNKFKLLRDMTEILNIDTHQFCDSSSPDKTDKIKLWMFQVLHYFTWYKKCFRNFEHLFA